MYIGNLMKIAIIGCSYSSIKQDNVGTNCWTYQLSQLYPQHDFLSYAIPGSSPEYHKLCYYHCCNESKPDIVLLSTTHKGRRTLFRGDNAPTLLQDYSVNYENLKGFTFPSGDIEHWTGTNESSNSKFISEFRDYYITTESYDKYYTMWYKSLIEYPQIKTFILDFSKSSPPLYYHNSYTVWEMLEKKFGNTNAVRNPDNGISLGWFDDHWTYEGNKLVLNEYILKNNGLKNLLDFTNQ